MKIEEQIKSTKPIPIHTKSIINMIYTTNHINEKIIEALKPFDLTIQQYNVLRILRGQKGKPANLGTVQERMVNKMSNTTRLIDKLIKKKLVTRTICPSNRRKIEILITDDGLQLLKQTDPIMETNNLKITKSLTIEELELLNTLLDKLKQ